MPELYVIGGANGSGKTTVSLGLLPRLGVLDNSEPEYQLVAEGITGQAPIIYDRDTWTLICRREDD